MPGGPAASGKPIRGWTKSDEKRMQKERRIVMGGVYRVKAIVGPPIRRLAGLRTIWMTRFFEMRPATTTRLLDVSSRRLSFAIFHSSQSRLPHHFHERRLAAADFGSSLPVSHKIPYSHPLGFGMTGGALPPGAHANGMRKFSPSRTHPASHGIQLSPSIVMRPAGADPWC
jgi:hypothetical protein